MSCLIKGDFLIVWKESALERWRSVICLNRFKNIGISTVLHYEEGQRKKKPLDIRGPFSKFSLLGPILFGEIEARISSVKLFDF